MKITTLDQVLPVLACVIYNEAESFKIEPDRALSKVILGSLVTVRHMTEYLEPLGMNQEIRQLNNMPELERYSPILVFNNSNTGGSESLTIIRAENLDEVESRLAEMLGCHFRAKELDPKYPGIHRNMSLLHQADFWAMREAA